ncbi:P74 [Buzura suppressaria nucleopolyhedrovirus]|uniref:p74 n=1 Tax=Buzura suppressaria nuclear polyhedrosis virus TaxID=74320 RepID=W5VS25_NPVBS|nr:P74 [Buzura suppressaria nucleopolyhedrovirus]AHH82612.1 P74 [Buzura suppressaria nucleopolyhedrovirus]
MILFYIHLIHKKMATLTTTDLTNASKYASHLHRLNFIPRWRTHFPHILINYEIRPANNDDYYVPPRLADRAIAVRLTFSRRGCESMSCYPFTETGPIDYSTPFGYTQTSDTSIAYAQPACYNLDRASATRADAEAEVQAPELRYIESGQCIIMNTLTKMYFNSPYLRTDEHLIKGVDDVPGFNVQPNSDPLLPEMFSGTFNQAYCRRFGRSLQNGGCSMQWWESLIGFVLGDTIYTTFKLATNNIFSELRDFDYKRPSPELPAKPTVDSEAILQDWFSIRDSRVDLEYEKKFADYKTLNDLNIDASTRLVYTAEEGFTRLPYTRPFLDHRKPINRIDNELNAFDLSDNELEVLITQFLEDNALILGLYVSAGFDNVLSAFKYILKRINASLIPAMKRALLATSKRVTVKLLGETYKAAIVHQINMLAIKTISSVAKAMTKVAIKAASVVGILLILLTIADLVLALWDPFGYSNMFPRQFPDDLAFSFIIGYFNSFGETRDILEMLPEFFDYLIENTDVAMFESFLYLLDYVSELEVNSNGQLLNFEESAEIDDFDEATLVGNALASSSLYTRLDFDLYAQRHNAILFANDTTNTNLLIANLFGLGALIIVLYNANSIKLTILFVVFVICTIYLIIQNSLLYYFKLRQVTASAQTKWYKNLYE